MRPFPNRVEHLIEHSGKPGEFAECTAKEYPAIMLKLISGITLLTALACGLSLRADQVKMQNGDILHGAVLSVTTNELVLQNENLGRVALPRAKVAAIILGTSSSKPSAPLSATAWARLPKSIPAETGTNSNNNLNSALRGLSNQTNLIQQVEAKFLAGADPAAVTRFNQLLDGLSTGKIDMNDLRAQAQSAADQLRSLKQGLSPDAGGEVDAYLAILDDFLKETAPANAATPPVSPTTNAPPAGSPAKP
jgi:hypothetical protein